jgi:hypothetical protein
VKNVYFFAAVYYKCSLNSPSAAAAAAAALGKDLKLKETTRSDYYKKVVVTVSTIFK